MLTTLLVSILTLVQLNCENLFDCTHDSLKEDIEYTPEGNRYWTAWKYGRKTESIAQELIGCCGNDTLPDLITLCEVENDSVMQRLTRRTSLARLGYNYIMTQSRDKRGIDVALIYNVISFRPIHQQSITPDDNHPEHPLRDILYVAGVTATGDTLHVIVTHTPSKFGSKRKSEARRMVVIKRIAETVDSIRNRHANAKIIVSGDFNDSAKSTSMQYLEANGLINATKTAIGSHGAKGSYKYKGIWESIDHILVSESLHDSIIRTYVADSPYLTQKDLKYGGIKPHRSSIGYRFDPNGYSDHLPVILKIRID